MDERLSEAMQRLGEACVEAARALGEFASACLDAFSAMVATVDWSALLNTANALNEAPPRVRHLAKYSRKGRVRKKNLHRALHKH